MENVVNQRIIALVDMDCFYCQVEARLNPDLQGKPLAVVQYNQWQGGGLIAVNYEAKEKGVTRGMRGAEAKQLCEDINLVSVPVLRGKSDLTKYRDAGDEVADIFSSFSNEVQRASIDEAYIDLTKVVNEKIKKGISIIDESQFKSTYIVGFSTLKNMDEEQRRAGLREWINSVNEGSSDTPEFRLAVGGLIVEEIREQVLLKTGFHCSAGIAHNKILAKLAAGLHKPKHQTILPQDGVPELYNTLPVYKVRNLGGKFGKDIVKKLTVKYMSEIYKYSLKELQQKFDEKSGLWLYNIARGIDLEPVTSRLIPGSIGCCKNFYGKIMLTMRRDVKHWVGELASEISERLYKDLEKNKRRAKLLTVTFHQKAPISRCEALSSYDVGAISKCALDVLNKFNNAPPSSDAWDPPIKHMGLSASKFVKEQENLNKFLTSKSDATESQLLKKLMKPSGDSELDCRDEVEPPDNSKILKDPHDETIDQSKKSSFFLSFLNNHRLQSNLTLNESPNKSDAYDQAENQVMSENKMMSSKGLINNGTKVSEPVASRSIDSASTTETHYCEECNDHVNILDFFEHLDYHTALKLQAEINQTDNQHLHKALTKNNSTLVTNTHNKRRRLESGKSVGKKGKSIKSFFKVLTK